VLLPFRRLDHLTEEQPEITDLIVSHDPVTLERLPVHKESVLDTFGSFQNRQAIAVVRAIPDHNGFLDRVAVDRLLLTVHWEMQRLAEEFFQGHRVSELLGTVITALRAQGFQRPVRVVDVGCGIGYVIRWLAARTTLPSQGIELAGVDLNSTLIREAARLATAENLPCRFLLLCGCRTAMGRCPLIRLRPYYAAALLRGFFAAQAASLIAIIALILVFLATPDRGELRGDLELAARRMLWIFLPYAATVLSSLALRLVPSTDIRSASSVFLLGPLTAIRPVLMTAGVLVGIYSAHLLGTRLLGLIVLALMLCVELVLNHLSSRRQSRQIQTLV
jgi:hypothetical protein